MPADRPFTDAIQTLTATLSDAVAAVLPADSDWRERLAPVIEATLDRLVPDLVPRADFERQRAQLEQLTREVSRLEARISALEPRPSD